MIQKRMIGLKKQYILDMATVNSRFVILCLGALSSAALTARSIKNTNFNSLSFFHQSYT